jgi:cyclophilin family peptidyl-prolyl cis-trans isomerase
LALSILLFSPLIGVQGANEGWRDVEVDMSEWDDGPILEGSPMDEPRPGDAVLKIEVDYKPSHLGSRIQGEIIIELFEEWAPNTTKNMIMHVELTIYDSIFFHRVIDDFVIQAGDPTCKAVVAYPATSPECGSGGDGHTLDLEHNENLSHVDGAIGMARSQDPNSADTQWYIAETEAHNLDPENRDDEGYATFGIVRNGMSHVRAIALTPTSDDPTGNEEIQNPASSAGRPIHEAKIIKISMIGVIPNSDDTNTVQSQSFFSTTVGKMTLSIAIIAVVAVIIILTRIEAPSNIETIPQPVVEDDFDAILLDEY